MVVNEVAITTDTVCALDDLPKARPCRRCRQRFHVASGDDRTLKIPARPDVHRVSVDERTFPLFRPGELAIRRCIRDAENKTPAAHQCNLRGKERTVTD